MSEKTQVMLDLETLGNKPGSVILAIGAVKFSATKILDTFYMRVNPESCVKWGLRMDVSTVMWWLKQNEAARAEIALPGGDLVAVLVEFSRWLKDENAEVWGNGAAFDNVLLADAYDRVNMERPWKFWNDRCYRTVKTLFPGMPERRTGTHHNALDDAISQAEHLMNIRECHAI